MTSQKEEISAKQYRAEHLFLVDIATKKIKLTQYGLSVLGSRLRKIGINPYAINTPDAFRQATNLLFQADMREAARTIKGKEPLLDEVLRGLPGWED